MATAPPTLSFAPLPDVVLQCAGCKTILGDTHEFICCATVEGVNLVVIAAAADVTVDRIAQITTAGGASCTHFPVCCSGCGSVVGRMYTVTPPGLDTLSNGFAMDASRCTSYRLGSADVRLALSNQAQLRGSGAQLQTGRADADVAAHLQGVPEADPGSADLLARVETLEAELLKMQGMILLHDAQLQTLPSYPSPVEAAPGDAGGGGGVATL